VTDPTRSGTTATDASQRDWPAVMADAVQVLTEAARLRRAVLEQGDDGSWNASATRTEQADWAEFVTLAIAGAAANIGSTEVALAGRPGSWEAEGVRALLASTVGADDDHLMEHRREPIRVTVWVEDLLADTDIPLLHDESLNVLDAQERAEAVAFEQRFEELVWQYRLEEPGRWVALDSHAPPFSLDAWRTDLRLQGRTPTQIEQSEYCLNEPDTELGARGYRTTYICRNAEARAELMRLEREGDERPDLLGALERLRFIEYAEYGAALTAEILTEAERRYPGVPIEVTVDPRSGTSNEVGDAPWPTPEAYLITHARLTTPLPGSAIAPKDYPDDRRISTSNARPADYPTCGSHSRS
jgi:hypothetical protein